MNLPQNKILTVFWKICFAVMLLFGTVIALFLAYYSTFYSYYSGTDYAPVYVIQDSWKRNLLVFAGCIVLTLLLEAFFKKLQEYQQLAGYCFLGICCVIFFIAGYLWVSQVPYYPSGDQLNTTAAAYYHLNGNFSMLQKGGYLGIYSQQKGLVFLYEILFKLFGDFCYDVAALFHVLSGVLTMVFGYLFLEDSSNRITYRILYCFCILFCTPYIILMPYAYGDIPSICCCAILFWTLRRYSLTFQKRYVVIACLAATLALFTRMNSWIVLIAMAIGLCLLALEKRRLQPVFACACIILSAVLSVELLDFSYEIRSGYEDTHGTPASLFLAMGMQDNEDGPGIYNRFNQASYESVDFNREAAAEIGWVELHNRLTYFKDNPGNAVTFFKTKVEMQWLEPLFETLISTYSFSEEEPMPQWIDDVYHGKYHEPLFHLANSYQCVVYLAFAAFLLFLPWSRKDSLLYIPLIAVIGGFLFSIIWEAQCRYVLPYYLFMLVYVPIGLCNICDGIAWIVRKIVVRRHENIAIATESEGEAAA